MTAAELAIARSVIYASLFDYPLTVEELHRSLIECHLAPQELTAVYAHSRVLPAIVEHRDGFFFPAGRRDLIPERLEREARSRAFLETHGRMVRLICGIPFTRLVALSGSLAHMNLAPDGDLDLFVITRGRRVWTVTLAVLLLTKLLGRRRVICANFVISDSHLALDQQDLFTANQVIHLRPLIGADALEEFVAANPFVEAFYPNAARRGPYLPHDPGRQRPRSTVKRVAEALLALPSVLIETASRAAYGWYLRRRARSWRSPEQVRLRSDYLKLHTKSHRQSILDRFDRAMQDALDRAAQVTDDTATRIRSAGRR